MANQMGMVFSKLDCKPRWRERLSELTVPALVVHGRQEPVVPLACSYYLAENLPQADLHVMNRCGHWTQIEHAAAFNELVLDFLDQQPG